MTATGQANGPRMALWVLLAALVLGCSSDEESDKPSTSQADAASAATPSFAYVNGTIDGKLAIVSRGDKATAKVLRVGKYAHGLGVSPNGRWVAVANHDSATISVVDTRTKKVVKTLRAGKHCIALSFHPSGQTLWTVNQLRNEIQVNAVGGSWQRLACIPVGSVPHQVKFTFDGAAAVVPCRTELYFIDTEALKVAYRLRFPKVAKYSCLRVVCAADSPIIYVSHSHRNRAYIIEANTGVIRAQVPTGRYPLFMALSKDGRNLYTANRYAKTVTSINCATGKAKATVKVGEGSVGMTFNAAGTRLYVSNSLSNSISVIDVATNKVCDTIKLQGGPFHIYTWPGTDWIVSVNGSRGGSISLVSDTSRKIVQTIPVQMNCPHQVVFAP